MITSGFAGALAAYAFVTSITPGPNNTMLIASGANFGYRRSIPHILGITIGFSLMLIAVGLGLGGLVLSIPALYRALQIAGVAYMIYLAWKIATAGSPQATQSKGSKPLTFLQAAAFQWVNPKAWILCLGVVSAYLPQQDYFPHLAASAIIFALVNCPCVSVWAGAGELLRNLLHNKTWLRLFNWSMAALLLASLYPMLSASLPGAP